MSEVREAPAAPVAAKITPYVADREFLPADLEILETPPSPVRMALILLIGALVVCALVWSWFGRLDIIAVAQGKIQPAGRVKVIQPLEAGKIAAIRIENGQQVKAGDVLIEMDAGDAQAEEANAQSAYDAYGAEALRRSAALRAAQARKLAPPPPIDWRPETPQPIRLREEQVLSGDLAQLADAVASYDAQIRQKEIERDRLTDTMAAQSHLIATLQERVDMRSSLVKSGSGAKSALIDAEETMQYHAAQLSTQQGQRDAAVANLDVLARDRDKTFSNFIAENGQKLDEAQRQADDARQKLVKAKLKSERMELRAPIDGTVYGLSVSTIGQVTGGGE
jgi:hemolysin D